MKRSPMPRRKKPMESGGPLPRYIQIKQGAPLRRSELARGAAGRAARPAADSPRTRQTRPDIAHKAAVRETVFTRDVHRCRLGGVELAGPCMGQLTVHHLRKASARGPYIAENLVTLCACHNDWVESSPAADLVDHWGLRIRHGGHHVEAWALMQLAGLVDWWWDGTPATDPQPWAA